MPDKRPHCFAKTWRLGQFALLLAALPWLLSPSFAVFAQSTTLGDKRQAIADLLPQKQTRLAAGDKGEAARLANRLGSLYLELREPQQALAEHREALALARAASDQTAEADSLNGLSAASLQLPDDKQNALSWLEQALSISRKNGYKRGQAEAFTLRSTTFWQSDPKASIEAAQLALPLWHDLGDKDGAARAHFQMGDAYTILSEVEPAEKAFSQALQLWQETGDANKQASALVGLSYLYQRQGEWEKAIVPLEKASSLADETADPNLAGRIANGYGFIHEQFGQVDLAEKEYRRGLQLYRQSRNAEYELSALLILGNTQLLQGHANDSLGLLNEALPLAIQQGRLYTAYCQEKLGLAHLALGEYDQASRYLNQSLQLYREIPAKREIARVQTFLGQYYQERGQFDQAARQYQAALDGFRSFQDRNAEATLYYALGQLAVKQNRLDKGLGYLETSIKLTERLRVSSARSDLRISFLASTYNRYESYVDALMQSAGNKDQALITKAWETNEQGRARTLLESISGRTRDGISAGVDPALREREQELGKRLTQQEKALSAQTDSEKAAAEKQKLEELQRRYDEVAAQLRETSPQYANLTQGRAWSLAEVQAAALDKDTALLEYALGEERSYLWLVTQDRLQSWELPPRAAIEKAGLNLAEKISTRPAAGQANDWETASAELSRLILEPAAAQLNKPRLVIVGDGILQRIPFNILRLANTPEKLLMDSHEIVYAPSASVLAETVKNTDNRQAAPKVVAAFGDPVLKLSSQTGRPSELGLRLAAGVKLSELKPLYFSRREVEHIGNLVAPEGRLAVMGADSTIKALQNTDLRQYQILHFSTHSIFDNDYPERSGIVLSAASGPPDKAGRFDYFSLKDVYNLPAPLDLVVLSACSTGLGKNVRGEGLIGMTRGFMYAGAASVMSSLWEVDDEATAELMRHAYDAMLREGKTPAAALRAAQNTIRRQAGWQSPYYWAAFTLQGQYRRAITPAPPSSFPTTLTLAVLAALFATLGIFYLIRYRFKANKGLN